MDLYNNVGQWITEQKVENVAVDYSDDLFNTISPSKFEFFLNEITPNIIHQMNQRLIRIATEDEVKQALFMITTKKQVTPYGMI